MADFNLPTADWSWGAIRGENADYATARSTYYTQHNKGGYVGQDYSSPNYKVYRALLWYDTSSLGVGAVISKANLVWTYGTYGNFSGTDFTIYVVKFAWDTSQNFYNDTNYDGVLSADIDTTFLDTADIVNNSTHTSGDLDITRINKTGETMFGLISSRDINANTPTGTEYVRDIKPTLSVTLGGSTTVHKFFPLLGVGK